MTAGTRSDCAFTAAYEALRTWAVARPRASQSPPGALLVVRRGLAAWLRD